MAKIEETEISLTALANNFKEDDVSRDMLLNTLVRQGFLIDIRTITDKGLANGISYKEGNGGAKWPVYSKAIQERLANNISYMIGTFPELAYSKTKKETKPKSQPKTSTSSTVLPINGSYKYKYLGFDDNFVILDTETTGLSESDEIVELSVVSCTGEELYHSYYYPNKEVDPGASRVNHLTRSKLEGNPRFTKEEWIKIKEIVNGKRICGHNISFDERLICQTLSKNGDKEEIDSVHECFKDQIDTKVVAKKWIQNNSYSLNNLTTLIGITREEQHDSTDDCVMTLEFINRLEDILVIKKEYDFIK